MVTARTNSAFVSGMDVRSAMGERADCTVRALASALALPYRAAHKLAERYGRKKGQGMRLYQWKDLLKGLEREGKVVRLDEESITVYYKSTGKRRRMRISTFLKHHPTGSYILDMRAHAGAVVDGKVVDLGGVVPNQYVLGCWKVVGG